MPAKLLRWGVILTGEDYFKTLGMPIKEGRDFTGINDSLSVILNETAIRRLRIKNPINKLSPGRATNFTLWG